MLSAVKFECRTKVMLLYASCAPVGLKKTPSVTGTLGDCWVVALTCGVSSNNLHVGPFYAI